LSEIKEQLARFDDLRLVVLDPLQAFVAADVNADPAAAHFLWSIMSELAATTGATTMLTHHMQGGDVPHRRCGRCPGSNPGTTALVDGADGSMRSGNSTKTTPGLSAISSTCSSSPDESCGAPSSGQRRSQLFDATPRASGVGLLVQLEDEPPLLIAETATSFPLSRAREVLQEVQRRFDAGVPFSPAPQAQARYLGHYLVRQFQMERKAAAELITDWVNNGVLTVEMCDRKTKLSGLKVQRWL
jgi:hypothetical protein